MMLRSPDNIDQINEEYHDPTGLETPSRAQLPRMLSMTLAEFDERVAEAIRAQTQNLVSSSTANRQNVSQVIESIETNGMCIYTPRTEDVLPVREIWQKVYKVSYNICVHSYKIVKLVRILEMWLLSICVI